MIRMEFEEDPGITMPRIAKGFKEDASQATARLAVATGKQCAIRSQPWGLGREAKNTINNNIIDAGKRICYVVKSARYLMKLRGQAERARIKYKMWEEVRPNQIMTDADKINRHIDKIRAGHANPPRYIPWVDMIVCSKTTFDKAMRLRRKRTGMNKGGWLGAGIRAAGLQAGPDRAKIGKNVGAWAQKHRRKGTARWTGSGREMELINYTSGADGLLPNRNLVAACVDAWENTYEWYKKAIKRRERKTR